MLQDRLEGTVLFNLAKDSGKSKDYDCIVVGGSIYAGRIHPKVAGFCARNLDVLFQKKLGLFICCADLARVDGANGRAFDERLGACGGWQSISVMSTTAKMNLLIRTIIRLSPRFTRGVPHCTDNIERFAEALR